MQQAHECRLGKTGRKSLATNNERGLTVVSVVKTCASKGQATGGETAFVGVFAFAEPPSAIGSS